MCRVAEWVVKPYTLTHSVARRHAYVLWALYMYLLPVRRHHLVFQGDFRLCMASQNVSKIVYGLAGILFGHVRSTGSVEFFRFVLSVVRSVHHY